MRRGAPKRWARRAAVVLALSAGLVLLAHPFAGAASDVWGNVGPASPLGSGGLPGRYPLSHYALDQHFEAISASLTGGVDASGVAPMIAYFLTSVLWALTSFLANLLIELFGFAFSLDLVRGSDATGGAGALGPVARAIHAIYANVFGGPWLALAVTVAGIWAMWKALVQRRYAETAGALALSLIYIVAALFFVFQPAQTIGAASQWANRMSVAFLSVADHGDASGGAAARDAGARQLFDLLVFKPWVVLEFGGVEHCVRAGSGDEDSDPDSVAVRPLSADPATDASLARRLRAGEEVGSGGKVCVNNAAKYAHRFLGFGPGTEERDAEYDALNHGDASRVAQDAHGYRLGVADKPATDAMEEGGQYQRLLIAILVLVGELGAFCLLGALAVGVILAQVLLLLTLAFAPVALVAAAIPGRGHAFFKSWLEKLAGYLLRKVAYSLLLAILLAVNGALASATDSLGWLLSFGLQALFFWAVFLQRKALSESLIGIATGSGAPGREGAVRVLGLYYGARVAGRGLRGAGRAARSAAGAPGRALGRLNSRRAARSTSPAGPAPLFGTSYSRQVGYGAPAAKPGRRSQSRERGRAGGERGERDERGEGPGSRREPLTEPAARAWDDAQRRERGDQSSAPERPRGPGSSKSADGRPARRARQAPPGPPEAPAENRKGDGESLDAELRAERERHRRDPRKPDAGKPAEDAAPRRPRRFSRLRRGRRRKGGR